MLNVGLTGGIGSGKSTVVRLLEKRGAFVIDFDELAHRVEEPDAPAWKKIVAHFGEEILNDDRTVNRARLGAIVFGDRTQLKALNAMVHPAVFDEWTRMIEDIRSAHPDAVVVSDVPLLIEAGMQKLFDIVVLVYLRPEAQIERIMKRNGLNREEAAARIGAQMPIDEKIPLCDFVIENDGDIGETEKKVDAVWQEMMRIQEMKGKGLKG